MKKYIYKIIILTSIIILPLFSVIAAPLKDYVLMEEIPGMARNVAPNATAEFIVQVYWYIFGLGVALAVLMITVGGIQYTLGWTPAGSGDAKGRITNAVYGLIILFTSWLLLYTINPATVGLDLNLNAGECISKATTAASGGGGGGGGSLNISGNTSLSGKAQPGETASEALLRNARSAADPNNPLRTNSRNGCAAGVNYIASVALGAQIGGGYQTAEMYKILQANPDKFEKVSSPCAGCLIISPTTASRTGHVGICESNDCVKPYSNSSNKQAIAQTISANGANTYWEKTYGTEKYYFKVKDSAIVNTGTTPAQVQTSPSQEGGGAVGNW